MNTNVRSSLCRSCDWPSATRDAAGERDRWHFAKLSTADSDHLVSLRGRFIKNGTRTFSLKHTLVHFLLPFSFIRGAFYKFVLRMSRDPICQRHAPQVKVVPLHTWAGFSSFV